jgi:DNA-binding PadR family transcriptional regulator
MSSIRLSETSFIVLGLLEQFQPATPYDLKRVAQVSTINFWNVPHTQLYSECARLAQAGLLTEEREQEGRRRRIYRVTESGAQALARWRSEPTGALEEVRDVGTLKLFFGADPASLAAAQLEAHRRQLVGYERLHESSAQMQRGMRLALEAGIGHERESIRFWSQLLNETDPPPADVLEPPLRGRPRR